LLLFICHFRLHTIPLGWLRDHTDRRAGGLLIHHHHFLLRSVHSTSFPFAVYTPLLSFCLLSSVNIFTSDMGELWI
jgi:hypothetical protein